MKRISHRGNISGKVSTAENRPKYIESAITLGYDVEIDIWVIDGQFWLGHDTPDYPISFTWLIHRGNSLWIHCKNVEAVKKLIEIDADDTELNYFWHENDQLSITSNGYIWTTDINITGHNVIWMITENIGPMNDFDQTQIYGVCADNLVDLET